MIPAKKKKHRKMKKEKRPVISVMIPATKKSWPKDGGYYQRLRVLLMTRPKTMILAPRMMTEISK